MNLKTISWENVISLPDGYDNIVVMMDLLLSLPSTSVNNETCFSLAKLTKTKRRGHLNTTSLNDLLIIQTCSASVEKFDPTEAIERWMVCIYFCLSH